MNLPNPPNTSQELEDLVAALFQASGYYVEKNVTESDPTDVLELDIVATDYAAHFPVSVVAEAKSGVGWGFGDAFKLAGQMQYLRLDRGGLFVAKELPGKDIGWMNQKVKSLRVSVVKLDFNDATTSFTAAGFGTFPHPEDFDLWRQSHHVTRHILRSLDAQTKLSPPPQAALAIKKYHRLVNDGIFFVPELRERIAALYEAYQEHPRLSYGCALELTGQQFDPSDQAPKSAAADDVLKEALREGKHPLLQAAFFVEHRARLAILKCAVDLLLEDPTVAAALKKATIGVPLVPLSDLPHSFKKGLVWLSAQPTFRRYALFWQVLLWARGGFYLQDQVINEFNWLSERTGVPASEVANALQAMDKFFPNSWIVQPGYTSANVVKMTPTLFMGIGAEHRRQLYGWTTCGQAPYPDYTGGDLQRWSDALATVP